MKKNSVKLEKPVEEQLVEQILAHPNDATNGLSLLVEMTETKKRYYTSEHLKEKYHISLNEDDLEPTILSKILEKLRNLLIKRYNAIAKNDSNKEIFELSILLVCLENLRTNEDFLVKNEKTDICQSLVYIILNNDTEQQVWLDNYLKKIRFN